MLDHDFAIEPLTGGQPTVNEKAIKKTVMLKFEDDWRFWRCGALSKLLTCQNG